MLAFATVLSLIKIVDMPFGGSVTACSMLPILIIAYRYGTKWGLFTAFAASLLMPTAAAGELIHRGRLRDAKDLCDIFGVSLQSAQLRMQQLERTGTQLTELEEQLRQRYLPVIEEYLVAPVITLPRSRLEPPPLLL